MSKRPAPDALPDTGGKRPCHAQDTLELLQMPPEMLVGVARAPTHTARSLMALALTCSTLYTLVNDEVLDFAWFKANHATHGDKRIKIEPPYILGRAAYYCKASDKPGILALNHIYMALAKTLAYKIRRAVIEGLAYVYIMLKDDKQERPVLRFMGGLWELDALKTTEAPPDDLLAHTVRLRAGPTADATIRDLIETVNKAIAGNDVYWDHFLARLLRASLLRQSAADLAALPCLSWLDEELCPGWSQPHMTLADLYAFVYPTQ